jgi:hypothetical protein
MIHDNTQFPSPQAAPPRGSNPQRRKLPRRFLAGSSLNLPFENPTASPAAPPPQDLAALPIEDAVKKVLGKNDAELFLAGMPTDIAKKVAMTGKERARRYRLNKGAALREKERRRMATTRAEEKEAERVTEIEKIMGTPEFNPNRGMSMTGAPSGKGLMVCGGYNSEKVGRVNAAHERAGEGRKVKPNGAAPDGGEQGGRLQVKLAVGEETAKGKKMARLGKENAAIEREKEAMERRKQSQREGLSKPMFGGAR